MLPKVPGATIVRAGGAAVVDVVSAGVDPLPPQADIVIAIVMTMPMDPAIRQRTDIRGWTDLER